MAEQKPGLASNRHDIDWLKQPSPGKRVERPRWEYRTIRLAGPTNEWVDWLNLSGDTGWELVAVAADTIAILKRQVL